MPGDWKDPDGWMDQCVAQVARNDWSVTVLHDIAEGCLPRLPELCARLDELGVTYTQEFPDAVVLIRAGEKVSLSDTGIGDA